jgi:hypothetical protein
MWGAANARLSSFCQDQEDNANVASPYPAFPLIDRNLIPSFMAFCATAPGVRPSFFAACGWDNLTFANARKSLTSSFDHADTKRLRFAMNPPVCKPHIITCKIVMWPLVWRIFFLNCTSNSGVRPLDGSLTFVAKPNRVFMING